MSEEFKERSLQNRIVIELCGTPFGARHKLLIHNAIEDMLTDRLGRKIRGTAGIREIDGWPLRFESKRQVFEKLVRVQEVVGLRYPDSGILLVQDGCFAALIFVEMSKRAGVVSKEEADGLSRGLLPYARMEDFIILTLVNPRAALVRELYPKELSGYDELMRQKFIFFSVFNQAARRILEEFGPELENVELLEIPGDDFQTIDVFFNNADLVFKFLGLPTIHEYSEKLSQNPELATEVRSKTRVAGISTSLSGLTEEELKIAIEAGDWAHNPDKRKYVDNLAVQVIDILERKGQ